MNIRPSVDSDTGEINRVLVSAFGDAEGPEIVTLVAGLRGDATARPTLSLVAELDATLIGHVLFTRARLLPDHDHLDVQILAPLAVIEELHGQGVGGALVREGLRQLSASGVDLVFVLGHPAYYPRFGFGPAGVLGLDAPYPIPERHADAWMVQALRPGLLGQVRGPVDTRGACIESD